MNTDNVQLNDEVLSAYIDGALDPNERERVEVALSHDPGAQVRLQNMRAADERLRAAFSLQPVSQDDLIAAHIQTGAPLPAVRRSNPPYRSINRIGWWSAAAGVCGLALGLYVANYKSAASFANQSMLNASIVAALESVASGSHVERDNQTVAVLLSFKSSDGRYCRTFKWQTASRGAEGVACHNLSTASEGNGWQLIAWDATATATSNAFQTAGASEIIDGAMDRLGGDGVLDATQEGALIANKWRTEH